MYKIFLASVHLNQKRNLIWAWNQKFGDFFFLNLQDIGAVGSVPQ